MMEMIRDGLVKETVGITCTIQEESGIAIGIDDYSILTPLHRALELNGDMLASNLGAFASEKVINQMRQKDYDSDNQNAVVRWGRKNICIDPEIKNKRERKYVAVGTAASFFTETVARFGINAWNEHENRKAIYNTYDRIYTILRNYLLTDSRHSDMRRAGNELGRIRNGLPLSEKEVIKIHTAHKSDPLRELDELYIPKDLLKNDGLMMTLAYHLFVLYCQKYGDPDGKLAGSIVNGNLDYIGMDELKEYFRYLGYSERNLKVMVQDLARRYYRISNDQEDCLEFTRDLLNLYGQIPGADLNQISKRCHLLAQNDPYQLKRRQNQNKLAGSIGCIAGLATKKQDMVKNGAALALSQFQLEDGNAYEIMEKLLCKDGGMMRSDFSAIAGQSEQISKRLTAFSKKS